MTNTVAGESYAERVGMQVRDLIKTHEVLMHSEADMAARKVRHALANYMAQVDAVMGERDGGRAPRAFRAGESGQQHQDQIDIETQIAEEEEEEEASDG